MGSVFMFIHVLLDVVCVMLCGWAAICLVAVFLGDKDFKDEEALIVVWSLGLGLLALSWLVFDFIHH
jgi:hypothetical protein